MRFHNIVLAVLSPCMAAGAMGDLVQYESADRAVTAFMNCDGGTFQDADSVWWYSTIEQGNESSVVRAHQQSNLTGARLTFEGETEAVGVPFMNVAYSSSTLSTTLVLDSDVNVDLHWSYLLELQGWAADGGANMRISTLDGSSLFDLDMQFEGSLDASSEIELVAGSYLLEVYLDSSVSPSMGGGASADFQMSMAFSSVPAPGALAMLGTAMLVGRTRRRVPGKTA